MHVREWANKKIIFDFPYRHRFLIIFLFLQNIRYIRRRGSYIYLFIHYSDSTSLHALYRYYDNIVEYYVIMRYCCNRFMVHARAVYNNDNILYNDKNRRNTKNQTSTESTRRTRASYITAVNIIMYRCSNVNIIITYWQCVYKYYETIKNVSSAIRWIIMYTKTTLLHIKTLYNCVVLCVERV